MSVSYQLQLLRNLGLVIGPRQGHPELYAPHDQHVAVLTANSLQSRSSEAQERR